MDTTAAEGCALWARLSQTMQTTCCFRRSAGCAGVTCSTAARKPNHMACSTPCRALCVYHAPQISDTATPGTRAAVPAPCSAKGIQRMQMRMRGPQEGRTRPVNGRNHDHAFDRVHHPAAPGVQALRLQASSSTQTCNMQRKAGRQHPVCWDHQCRAAWATSSSSSRCWWLASSCTVAGHVDVLPAVGAGHCSTATAVTSSMALIGALCCCRWGVA
jgi:hypothetical protein